MSDLFAPPTKTEVERANAKIFAPPTADEVKAAKASAVSPSPPSNEPTWETKALEKANSAKSALFKFVGEVGRKVDSVTGAPARKALGTMQDGGGIVDAAKAGWEQFAADPELAPTGKEIAAKAGLSTEQTIPAPWLELDQKGIKAGKFSPAGAAGLGIDVIVDPTNFIPVSKIAKGTGMLAGKAISKGTDIGTGVLAAGVDAVTGTAVASKAVKGGKEQIQAAKAAMSDLFNPKRADDWEDMARIAERNGITRTELPESVEFGHDSIITRASRVRNEGILGQADLQRFREAGEKTKRATEAKVTQIAGGRILRPEEAGNLIREGYDQSIDRVMRQASDTYRSISSANPGLLLNVDETAKLANKLDELDKFADSRVNMGMTSAQKSQAKQLKVAVESLKSAMAEGQPLLDDMVQRLQILGEAAFKKQNGLDLDPPDLKRLRGLYGDMRESIVGTIEKDIPGGSKLAENLRTNNAAISRFLEERGPLERALGRKDLADERVYWQLVDNGDTRTIEALRQILTPEQFQQLKGTFLDGMLNRNVDGDFTFGSTVTRMRTNQTNFEAMLSPEEIKEFADLVRLGDRFGSAVMSTSGTGASAAIRAAEDAGGIGSKIKGAIVSESFIKSLKNRARAAPPAPSSGPKPGGKVQTPAGDMNLSGFSGTWGGGSSAAPAGAAPGASNLRGIDLRLKGAQVFSTQDFDENKARREAIRRRLDKEGKK